MAEQTEYEFSVEIEGVGRFTRIKSWNIRSSYLTPTDSFSFTVFDDNDPGRLRDTFRPWQPVKLYIGENLQLVGRIDSNEGAGPGEKDLVVRGRDYLADIIDSGIDPSVRIAKNETLEALVLRVLRPYGIQTVAADGYSGMRNAITGWNRRVPPQGFQTLQVSAQKADDNEGAFSFLNRILARHGYMLQPTIMRESVAIAKPEYDQASIYSFFRSIKTGDSNIVSGIASRDYSDVPTVTIARGRSASSGGTRAVATNSTRPTFGSGAISSLGDVEEVRRVFDGVAITELYNPDNPQPAEAGQLYRPIFYSDKSARTLDQLDQGLKRNHAKRLAETLTYRVDMQGVASVDGYIYSVDTIATVEDDVQAVSENLWVVERELSNHGNNGPMTSLRMIRPGSFVL